MLNRIIDGVRRLVAWKDHADPAEYAALMPTAPTPPAAAVIRRDAQRYWTSIEVDDSEAAQIGESADRRFKMLPVEWSEAMNEATTRSNLIEPMLVDLGWSPLNCEVSLPSGKKPDIVDARRRTVIEAKAGIARYDDIAALNPTKPYKNVAEQVVGYLNDDTVQSVIYTNGRFWWRVERDEVTKRLHALRFNLRLATNMMKIKPRQHGDLRHFTMLFHARAFDPGVNGATPIHIGRKIDYGTCSMLLKDLNKGLGWSEMP